MSKAVDSLKLRRQWRQLCAPYSHTDSVTAFWEEELFRRYTEPQRYYHDLSHIEALLTLLDNHRRLVVDPVTVTCAIWFHDAIYDPRAKDNEEQSADLARRALSEIGFAQSVVDATEACIRATSRHALSADYPPDLPVFLDFDLSILGASEPLYDCYRQQICAEYAWVAEDVYRAGRCQVLMQFSARERLYFTPELAEKWEAAGRANLSREITALQDPSI